MPLVGDAPPPRRGGYFAYNPRIAQHIQPVPEPLVLNLVTRYCWP